MMDYKNKKITVLGMARSGVAAANLLFESGAKVTLSDTKPIHELEKFITQLVSKDIRISASADQLKDIQQADLVILSPGIPADIPAVKEAIKQNIPVISEVELAYQFSKAPFIAITGSNGKTTTTSLVGEILKATFKGPVAVAGNIGQALCAVVKELPENGIVVAEISSFQLETIQSFRPIVAAILNITPNHMDRYPNMDAYAEAKMRIFEYQKKSDYLVINQDDNESMNRIKKISSQPVYFSRKQPVEFGTFVEKESIVYRKGNDKTVICGLKELRIPGEHNIENALAASAMVICAGIEPIKIKSSLTSFKGVEHRLEFVRELKGVKYINDSKATTVTAVMTALNAIPGSIILIAGGKDKGSDYTPLREPVKRKVKHLILIGQARGKIKASLNGNAPITETESMADAVQKASQLSQNGDTVLLSTACASFDMFNDFEERGRVFKKLVGELK